MQIQKLLKWVIIIAVGGFILIQLVPYGRSHDNPPVQSEPNWDSPEPGRWPFAPVLIATATKQTGHPGIQA